jgi:transposase
LVFDQQLSVAEAARNLGLHPNLLRSWKRRIEAENDDTSLTEDERMEIARLRAENRRLRMERDILKKAAAFFANETN